jgi:hypothetical protein
MPGKKDAFGGKQGKDGNHHHRSAFTHKHKAFKGKSKGKIKAQNKGRVSVAAGRAFKQSKPDAVQRKQDRLNRARQVTQNKRGQILAAKRLGSRKAAAKLVGFVSMSESADLYALLQQIGATCDDNPKTAVPSTNPRVHEFHSSTHKFHFMAYAAPHKDLLAILDIAKVVDMLVFVLTPNQAQDGVQVDAWTEHVVRAIKAQGIGARYLPTHSVCVCL